MIRGKHAFKAFSLALMAVLGLMALSAAGAQAEKAGVFLVAGGNPQAGDLVVTELEGKTGSLLTELKGGTKVEVLCEVATVTGTTVISNADLEGTIEFTKCKVKNPANCTVEEPIIANALVLALLHKPVGGVESTYIVFEPKPPATNFTSLHFKGVTCLLPTEEAVEIKGKSTAKDCENAILTEQQIHLLTELQGGTKLTGDPGLLWGARPASLDGSINVKVKRGASFVNWSAH